MLKDELPYRIIRDQNAREMEFRRLMRSFSVCNLHLIIRGSSKKEGNFASSVYHAQGKFISVRNFDWRLLDLRDKDVDGRMILK